MSDTSGTTTGTGGTDAGTDTSKGAAAPPVGTTDAGDGSTTTQTRTPEELETALRAANAESAARRKRLEELETAEAERVKASQTTEQQLTSERDTLKAQVADLEAKLANRELSDVVAEVAGALSFVNPALAPRLLDLDKVKGADGTVDKKLVEAELKAQLKANPYLATGSGGDGGQGRRGNNGATTTDMNANIRRAAGRS